MDNNIYCTVWEGSNYEPFRILPTNFERGKDDYILGVKANMVICIVNRNNHQLYDMPAPEELRVYADEVKEFMRNPFWRTKLRRYFDTSITPGEDADIILSAPHHNTIVNMYKLAKGERLYFVKDNRHCNGTHVEYIPELEQVKVSSIIEFKGKIHTHTNLYRKGDVGIFHVDDINDIANTPIDSVLSIIQFHDKLYEDGVLEDNIEDF